MLEAVGAYLAGLAGASLGITFDTTDFANSIFGSVVAVTGDAHQAQVAQDIFRQEVRIERSLRVREDIRDAHRLMLENVQTQLLMGNLVLGICFTILIEGKPSDAVHAPLWAQELWALCGVWSISFSFLSVWFALQYQQEVSVQSRKRLLERHRITTPKDEVVGRMGGLSLAEKVAQSHQRGLWKLADLLESHTGIQGTREYLAARCSDLLSSLPPAGSFVPSVPLCSGPPAITGGADGAGGEGGEGSAGGARRGRFGDCGSHAGGGAGGLFGGCAYGRPAQEPVAMTPAPAKSLPKSTSKMSEMIGHHAPRTTMPEGPDMRYQDTVMPSLEVLVVQHHQDKLWQCPPDSLDERPRQRTRGDGFAPTRERQFRTVRAHCGTRAWFSEDHASLSEQYIVDLPDFLEDETLVRLPWSQPDKHERRSIRLLVKGTATIYVAAQWPPLDTKAAFRALGPPASWQDQEMPHLDGGGIRHFERVEGFSVLVNQDAMDLPLYRATLAEPDPIDNGWRKVRLKFRFDGAFEAPVIIVRSGSIVTAEEDWPVREFMDELSTIQPLRDHSMSYMTNGLLNLLLAAFFAHCGRVATDRPWPLCERELVFVGFGLFPAFTAAFFFEWIMRYAFGREGTMQIALKEKYLENPACIGRSQRANRSTSNVDDMITKGTSGLDAVGNELPGAGPPAPSRTSALKGSRGPWQGRGGSDDDGAGDSPTLEAIVVSTVGGRSHDAARDHMASAGSHYSFCLGDHRASPPPYEAGPLCRNFSGSSDELEPDEEAGTSGVEGRSFGGGRAPSKQSAAASQAQSEAEGGCSPTAKRPPLCCSAPLRRASGGAGGGPTPAVQEYAGELTVQQPHRAITFRQSDIKVVFDDDFVGFEDFVVNERETSAAVDRRWAGGAFAEDDEDWFGGAPRLDDPASRVSGMSPDLDDAPQRKLSSDRGIMRSVATGCKALRRIRRQYFQGIVVFKLAVYFMWLTSLGIIICYRLPRKPLIEIFDSVVSATGGGDEPEEPSDGEVAHRDSPGSASSLLCGVFGREWAVTEAGAWPSPFFAPSAATASVAGDRLLLASDWLLAELRLGGGGEGGAPPGVAVVTGLARLPVAARGLLLGNSSSDEDERLLVAGDDDVRILRLASLTAPSGGTGLDPAVADAPLLLPPSPAAPRPALPATLGVGAGGAVAAGTLPRRGGALLVAMAPEAGGVFLSAAAALSEFQPPSSAVEPSDADPSASSAGGLEVALRLPWNSEAKVRAMFLCTDPALGCAAQEPTLWVADARGCLTATGLDTGRLRHASRWALAASNASSGAGGASTAASPVALAGSGGRLFVVAPCAAGGKQVLLSAPFEDLLSGSASPLRECAVVTVGR